MQIGAVLTNSNFDNKDCELEHFSDALPTRGFFFLSHFLNILIILVRCGATLSVCKHLHVSIIYSHRKADQKTVSKKTVIQCNKIVGKRSRLILLYCCTALYKGIFKRGILKGLWNITRIMKI
jgi:hypothetical protein